MFAFYMADETGNKPKYLKTGVIYVLKYVTFLPLTLWSTLGFGKSAAQIEAWQNQALEAAKNGEAIPYANSGVRWGLVIIIIVVLSVTAAALMKLLKNLKLIK